MPINPIHVTLMHSGKVLVVAGSENNPVEGQQQISLAAVWNPQTGTITTQNLQWDVFCNGGGTFPDGRFLIVGGTDQYDPFYGEARTTIFDPATEKFNDAENMAHGRWYANVTALSDGRLFTFSGWNEVGDINTAIEIYTVGSGWSPEYVAPWTPPLYPRLHLLPNGKLFYSGETPDSNLFDPSTHSWTLNVAHTVYGQSRPYGSSVLLPLSPTNNYAPRVLIMGGHDPATATAEIIDLSVANPSWRNIAPMSKPRIEMNAVILPNGKVLALGGSLTNEVASTASLQADLFDPAKETWSPAGVEAYPRLYHSVGLLLPDATVWVAGGNPVRGTYEQHMEIYTPPYLYTNSNGTVIAAYRPSITATASEIGYGGTFSIQTTNAPDIRSVVLVRPGAPTHSFDMEQRLIGLTFSNSASNTLTATAPPNGNIAPPGYYLLFILNSSGVPSVAKFVHLTSTPTDQPPKGTITSPNGDVTIQLGQSVFFDCNATDPDGTVATYSWIFPEGTPDTSLQQHAGSITFGSAGTYVVSLTAIDNAGVNDPSPPTRTITVQSVTLVASSLNPSGAFWVVANVTNVPTIAHVDFWVDGALYHRENVAPYCLFGDDDVNPFTGTLPNGAHTIIAKVYSNETTLVATSPSITVTVGSSSSPSATLVASSLNPSGPFWVVADVANVPTIAHVDFWVDGALYHRENVAPYCLFGDDDVNPFTGTLPNGAHTIIAQVYSSETTLVVTSPSITVTVGSSSSPSATLVASSLNPSGAFWVVADVANVPTIAHVDFWVDGALYHRENVAPYCLFGDDDVNPFTGTLPSGAHTIIAKVYSSETTLVVTSPSITVTVQ
jgi:hypothetical protein